MANFKVIYVFTVTDVDGHQSNVSISGGPTGDTNTLAALKTNSDTVNTALAAVTNGKVTRRSLAVTLDEAQGVGTDAEFPNIEQRASAVFANAEGSKAILHVPAPVEAIFRSPPVDDIVDPNNALMSAFITAVQGVARDQGANPLNLFLGGAMSTRRRARRVSIRS